MLAFLGRLSRRVVPRPFAFVRLAAELTLVAALLGRSAPEPAPEPAPRQPAHIRYLGVDGSYVGDFPASQPVLLDTETGALASCPLAGMRQVGVLGCSPWRDGEGRFHLAGIARKSASGGHVLVRSTFPTGRILDRVKVDVLPARRPCWFPDRSDRILFGGTDRRLYVFDFPEARRARTSDPAPLRAVRWQVEPPGVGEVWLVDPCWPSAPALGGRLIVSLSYNEDASLGQWKTKLWWLQLSPEGDAIVGAERVIVPDAPGRSQVPLDELFPNVGMASDGTPLLAYLAQNRHQGPLELWVIPIAPAAPDRGPRVLRSAGRRLAEGCASVLPVFSADGRWVYAWRWVDLKLRVERLAVPVAADASAGAVGSAGLRRIDHRSY